MRNLLAHADLARYAGQFVWLELNDDKSNNRRFLTKYGASATPTFFIVDPRDGTVAATKTGAMSLIELTEFLERGANSILLLNRQTRADVSLKRGDALLVRHPGEAAGAYREALRSASADWPKRD